MKGCFGADVRLTPQTEPGRLLFSEERSRRVLPLPLIDAVVIAAVSAAALALFRLGWRPISHVLLLLYATVASLRFHPHF